MRISHPAPACDALEALWSRFAAEEKERMERSQLAPQFTKRADLPPSKEKVNDGPTHWLLPELKRRCTAVGISLKKSDNTTAKKKSELVADYLHYKNSLSPPVLQ